MSDRLRKETRKKAREESEESLKNTVSKKRRLGIGYYQK